MYDDRYCCRCLYHQSTCSHPASRLFAQLVEAHVERSLLLAAAAYSTALQLSEAAGETLDEQQQAKLDSLDAVLEEMESLMTG